MASEIPENTSKNTHNVVESLILSCQPQRMLDIPAGAGAFTQRMQNKGVEVHSADIENILMVDNKQFNIADMNQRLPYEDGCFDAIACIERY